MQVIVIARAIVQLIDATNERVGGVVSWLTLFMVLTQVIVVFMRYVFGIGWIALQESIVYMHATVFLAAAGYTLLHDGHIRVDVFYRPASERGQAAVNLVGSICLLLPMATAIFWVSWPYVAKSWSILETSSEGAGIPAVFLLKTVILIYAALVALQGVALGIRSAQTLFGGTPPSGTSATREIERS